MKKVAEIFETKEYELFYKITGNRELRKIQELKNKIEINGEYPFAQPILVTDFENKEGYGILDGQHRYFLCCEYNLPVRFLYVDIKPEEDTTKEELALELIRKLQPDNKWLIEDYTNSFADLGNKSYELVRELKSNSKDLELGSVPTLSLMTTDGKIYSDDTIKTGKLKLDIEGSEENWFNNYSKYMDIVKILQEENRVGYKQKYCVSSLVMLFNNEHYNHEHFVSQFKKYSYMFKTSVYSRKYFLEIFEDIYNYNSRKRPIRLF